MNPVLAACTALLACAAAQAAVLPPPPTPGSSMVNVQGGLNKAESDRSLRAHHHKFHYQKDYTRDDTIFGEPTSAAPNGAAGAGVSLGRTLAAVPTAAARANGDCSAAAAATAVPPRAGDMAAATSRPGDVAAGQARQAPGPASAQAIAAANCDLPKVIAVPKPAAQQKKPATPTPTAPGRTS